MHWTDSGYAYAIYSDDADETYSEFCGGGDGYAVDGYGWGCANGGGSIDFDGVGHGCDNGAGIGDGLGFEDGSGYGCGKGIGNGNIWIDDIGYG